MRSKTSISIILITFFTSALSATLLLFYLDPESNFLVAFSTMGVAVFLALASFLSILLYIFKKIYYRGETGANLLPASVRQAILISLSGMGILALHTLSLLTYRTGGLLIFVFALFELMIQSVSSDS